MGREISVPRPEPDDVVVVVVPPVEFVLLDDAAVPLLLIEGFAVTVGEKAGTGFVHNSAGRP